MSGDTIFDANRVRVVANSHDGPGRRTHSTGAARPTPLRGGSNAPSARSTA